MRTCSRLIFAFAHHRACIPQHDVDAEIRTKSKREENEKEERQKRITPEARKVGGVSGVGAPPLPETLRAAGEKHSRFLHLLGAGPAANTSL